MLSHTFEGSAGITYTNISVPLRSPGIGTSASQKPRKPREVDVNNIVVPEGPLQLKPFRGRFAQL